METPQQIKPTIKKLQALTRLRPKAGCDWCVLAYALNKDIVRDGKVDDLHAMVFLLGSFETLQEAEKHSKSVIELTGYPDIFVTRYGAAFPLTSKFEGPVEEVPVDINGRLIEFETDRLRRDREMYDRRVKVEEDLAKEAELETDPETLEYCKRQCYLLVKNQFDAAVHKRSLERAEANVAKYKQKLLKHLRKHPSHETEWLPHLKEKLIERGELYLYNKVEKGYLEVRSDLLKNLTLQEEDEEDSEDDDIAPATN